MLDAAAREERVLVSANADFGILLARAVATHPSFPLISGGGNGERNNRPG